MKIHKYTDRTLPSGSIIAVFSDVHVPHHDEPALRLAIECCEDIGVTHTIANGDILDCGPASRHPGKRNKAVLDEGTLRESIEPGRWFLDWLRTRSCVYGLGNHEKWVEEAIKASPEFHGTPTTDVMGIPADGNGWTVLPSSYRIQYGSRAWEHGHLIFPSGSGGQNPGARIRNRIPDRTTSIGHLHIEFANFWTTDDEHGVPRTRGAFGNGHMSKPESHEDYAAYASWQQGFEITRVWTDGGRPRFTTDQVQIHRDRRGRPVFEYGGKVYR